MRNWIKNSVALLSTAGVILSLFLPYRLLRFKKVFIRDVGADDMASETLGYELVAPIIFVPLFIIVTLIIIYGKSRMSQVVAAIFGALSIACLFILNSLFSKQIGDSSVIIENGIGYHLLNISSGLLVIGIFLNFMKARAPQKKVSMEQGDILDQSL